MCALEQEERSSRCSLWYFFLEAFTFDTRGALHSITSAVTQFSQYTQSYRAIQCTKTCQCEIYKKHWVKSHEDCCCALFAARLCTSPTQSLRRMSGALVRRLHVLRFLLPDLLSRQRTVFPSNASPNPFITYAHTMTSLVNDAFNGRLIRVYVFSNEGRVEECQEEALELLKQGDMPRIHRTQTLVLLRLVLVD